MSAPIARLQVRLATALQRRGYQEDKAARSSRYRVFVFREGFTGRPFYGRNHKLLVGKAGALRLTDTSIAQSIPVRPTVKAQLLKEAQMQAECRELTVAKRVADVISTLTDLAGGELEATIYIEGEK